MNVTKDIVIPGWTINIDLEDTVNNVLHNIAITEESVNTKTDKKSACKFFRLVVVL